MKLSDIKTTLPPPKILLGGLAGVGKTAFAASYGDGMQFLGVDNALATCMTLNDDLKPRRMAIDFIDCIELNPTGVAKSFQKVKSHLIEMINRAAAKKLVFDDGKPITALAIDGLTFLAKAGFDYIMYNSGKLGKPLAYAPGDSKALMANNASLPEWGLMISEVIQIFQLIRALPITVVVTCHYEAVPTPMGGLQYQLAIPTKELPRMIPGMVDEVWYMETQPTPAGQKSKRMLKTVSSPLVMCRSNYNLPDGTDTACGIKGILKLMGVEA